MNYLLDTNILVIYVWATELTRKIEQDLKLLTGENDLVISVVTVGEIKSIADGISGEKRKLKTWKNYWNDSSLPI